MTPYTIIAIRKSEIAWSATKLPKVDWIGCVPLQQERGPA